jgi:hypothetical protein
VGGLVGERLIVLVVGEIGRSLLGVVLFALGLKSSLLKVVLLNEAGGLLVKVLDESGGLLAAVVSVTVMLVAGIVVYVVVVVLGAKVVLLDAAEEVLGGGVSAAIELSLTGCCVETGTGDWEGSCEVENTVVDD